MKMQKIWWRNVHGLNDFFVRMLTEIRYLWQWIQVHFNVFALFSSGIAHKNNCSENDQKNSVTYCKDCCEVSSVKRDQSGILIFEPPSSKTSHLFVEKFSLNFHKIRHFKNRKTQKNLFDIRPVLSHNLASAYLVCLDFSSSLEGGGMCSGSTWYCECVCDNIDGWYERPRL